MIFCYSGSISLVDFWWTDYFADNAVFIGDFVKC